MSRATVPPAALRRRRAGTGEDRMRVLLLHGIGGSCTVWTDLVARADPRWEIWDVALPWAHGGDRRWSHHPDCLPWVSGALATLGDVDVVVAHSFAATMLLQLLAQSSVDGCRPPGAVVLVSPFYREHPDEFDWATIVRYLTGFHRIFAESIRLSCGDRLPADVQARMAQRIQERIGPYGWMHFFAAYLRTPMLDLTRIGVPALVLTGERDIAARPADGRALARALPLGRLALLPGSGHFPMRDQPDRFAAALNEFVDAVASRPSKILLELT